MEWNAAFEVGVEEIDVQHRYFFLLVKQIKISDKSRLPPMLSELERYASFHFASEERLMDLYGFPNPTSHKEDHARILKFLAGARGELAAGTVTIAKIQMFVFQWFANHTTLVDAELGRHIQGARSEISR